MAHDASQPHGGSTDRDIFLSKWLHDMRQNLPVTWAFRRCRKCVLRVPVQQMRWQHSDFCKLPDSQELSLTSFKQFLGTRTFLGEKGAWITLDSLVQCSTNSTPLRLKLLYDYRHAWSMWCSFCTQIRGFWTACHSVTKRETWQICSQNLS